MRPRPCLPASLRRAPARLAALCLAACCLVGLIPAAPAPAQETTLAASDPCAFFRSRAWGKGLDDPATEMFWACEAIVARRAADIPLSDRLAAAEAALERFRGAVHDASAEAFVNRTRGFATLGLAPSRERDLAEASGVIAALEAIRERF